MADRHTLALHKIDDFAAWAENNGYRRESTKGEYEVLRLRPVAGGPPLIYFRRNRRHMHATCQEPGRRLVQKWISKRGEVPRG